MKDWTNHFEEVAGLLNYCERQHGIANAVLNDLIWPFNHALLLQEILLFLLPKKNNLHLMSSKQV